MIQGLTTAEVQVRKNKGLVNVSVDSKTKSLSQIIKDNLLTLFNIVNFSLAALVLTTGEFRNVLFIGIVLANLFIGIFQEIRAKRALDKLSLLADQSFEVLRDGTWVLCAREELVQDDIFKLSRGLQVPVDATLVEGMVEVDESLLTGESDTIEKQQEDEVLSGSFVYSGSCIARAQKVGVKAYAAKLTAEAKCAKPVVSEILITLRAIIAFATFALIPIGIVLFARTYFHTASYNASILSTVAAVVGMIPQGLILLTSSVMAIAATRLAKSQVLIQQMYCIESLARVNVVCLDKTGTITTGDMELKELKTTKNYSYKEAQFALAVLMASQQNDLNDTAKAIVNFLDDSGISIASQEIHDQIKTPIFFSSDRKYSGIVCTNGRSYVLGAYQFIFKNAETHYAELTKTIAPHMRLLALAEVDGFTPNQELVGTPRLMAVLGIEDTLRTNAKETIQYFIEQGVQVKIISGDDPKTVSSIAQLVEVPSAKAFVNSSDLSSQEDVDKAIENYTVFGRIKPEQKKQLVQALQKKGYVVAMTGDGVNDLLALKEADCSVAMASGSEAARNVSDIVLGDNDFSKMPEVVLEGRRSINNLTRSASLFLVKTVYSVILAALCILVPPYPFIPIQMSLTSSLLIGLPSFVLALEPNFERVQGNFLVTVLSKSLPASVSVILGCFAITTTYRFVAIPFDMVSTLCTLLVSVVGVILIYLLSRPFTTMRKCLLALIVVLLILGITVGKSFFMISTLTLTAFLYFLAVLGLSLLIYWGCIKVFSSQSPLIRRLFTSIEMFFSRTSKIVTDR